VGVVVFHLRCVRAASTKNGDTRIPDGAKSIDHTSGAVFEMATGRLDTSVFESCSVELNPISAALDTDGSAAGAVARADIAGAGECGALDAPFWAG
jgi:hypothetical protein